MLLFELVMPPVSVKWLLWLAMEPMVAEMRADSQWLPM